MNKNGINFNLFDNLIQSSNKYNHKGHKEPGYIFKSIILTDCKPWDELELQKWILQAYHSSQLELQHATLFSIQVVAVPFNDIFNFISTIYMYIVT